jgi:high-affinity nickel-transport protein
MYSKLLSLFFSASPQLRNRLITMAVILFVLNAGVWIATFLLSKTYPLLPGLVTIAYGLGLRHAVDADHIAAIDNTTRKLMQEKKRPVAVGFFLFSGTFNNSCIAFSWNRSFCRICKNVFTYV